MSDPNVFQETAQDLLRFIDDSPSPFHCVDTVRKRLEVAGFEPLDETAPWGLAPGDARYVVRGDGAITAFRVGAKPPSDAGFALVGAHTDSPGFRLKPQPAFVQDGWLRADVEVYGGPILPSWVDRDLGMAGRLYVAVNGRLEPRLVRLDRPAARIPALAIHLDRKVNDEGLRVDKHKDLGPAIGPWTDGDPKGVIEKLLAEAAGVEPDAIRGWDIGFFDLQPSAFGGLDDAFLHAPRLDNEAMCHAGMVALLRAEATPEATQVLCLFDHEEVGSGTHRGAAGVMLQDILGRVCEAIPGDGGLRRALANSLLVSADMAHALHPSKGDRHDGRHTPALNGGPVIKTNASQRYATDAQTGAAFRELAQRADVPVQEFAMRADLPCGSTIGPLSAAELGVRTVDVGNPMLSMHSVREMGGSRDQEYMTRILTTFFETGPLR